MSKMAHRRRARRPFGPWEQRVLPGVPRPKLGPAESWLEPCYVNNRYSVQMSVRKCELGDVMHLWIRRHDGDMVRSWADMQRIKNELAGPGRVAVEVFPASDEVVDQANMAHLWVYPEGTILPFTL